MRNEMKELLQREHEAHRKQISGQHTHQNSLNTLHNLESLQHLRSLEQAQVPSEVEVRRNNHILAKEVSLEEGKR